MSVPEPFSYRTLLGRYGSPSLSDPCGPEHVDGRFRRRSSTSPASTHRSRSRRPPADGTRRSGAVMESGTLRTLLFQPILVPADRLGRMAAVRQELVENVLGTVGSRCHSHAIASHDNKWVGFPQSLPVVVRKIAVQLRDDGSVYRPYGRSKRKLSFPGVGRRAAFSLRVSSPFTLNRSLFRGGSLLAGHSPPRSPVTIPRWLAAHGSLLTVRCSRFAAFPARFP